MDVTVTAEPLPQLNRLFVRALKALGDAGQRELACQLAAEGWSQIRLRHAEEAEKLNGALHYLTRPRRAEPSAVKGSTEVDVRELIPAQRHVVILETCTRLPVGEAIELINDHDPKPLYYQFEAEFPGQFGWSYLQSGPEVWRVQITRKQA
jgi:uncharacterized protein (DUF2249 family)